MVKRFLPRENGAILTDLVPPRLRVLMYRELDVTWCAISLDTKSGPTYVVGKFFISFLFVSFTFT